MKTGFLTLIWVILLAKEAFVYGQSLPTPENSGKDWVVREVYPTHHSGMPVKRMGNPSDAMPQPSGKSFSYNSGTGKPILYYDSKTKLGYDFEHGLMTDVASGRVYQFYKKGTSPKPLPDGYEH